MSEKPRILLFDLETAPNIGYTWGTYQQDVIQFVRPWFILCVSYKWLDEDEIHCDSVYDYDLFDEDPENDYGVCETLWELLNEADIAIAHNGVKFDFSRVRTRLLIHGFKPPSEFKFVDTLKTVRRLFDFNSNRLNDVCYELGLGEKYKHSGFQMWLDCEDGDPDAWDEMTHYAKIDVDLLEKLYLTIRAWDDRHPNLAVYDGSVVSCPGCGSENVQKRGLRPTNTMTYQQWWCKDCGKWSRTRLREKEVPAPKLK